MKIGQRQPERPSVQSLMWIGALALAFIVGLIAGGQEWEKAIDDLRSIPSQPLLPSACWLLPSSYSTLNATVILLFRAAKPLGSPSMRLTVRIARSTDESIAGFPDRFEILQLLTRPSFSHFIVTSVTASPASSAPGCTQSRYRALRTISNPSLSSSGMDV